MPSAVIFVRDTTNNKNVVLSVDGSNQLSVKDTVAQSSLSTMATASASQALASHQVTAQSSLTTLATASADQATAAHQVSAHNKLDTLNATMAGTLTVSSSAPSRSSGQLASAASKTAGDISSSIDGNSHRKCVIFGSCSSDSGSVKVHISHDDINFFEDNQAQYYANFSNGHIAGHFELNARYFKVEFMDTATYTLEYAMVD